MNFVVNLTDERLYSTVKYVSTEGYPHERALWECMMHLINHASIRQKQQPSLQAWATHREI